MVRIGKPKVVTLKLYVSLEIAGTKLLLVLLCKRYIVPDGFVLELQDTVMLELPSVLKVAATIPGTMA